MTVMIALVGGQPLPNLLPVRHYNPAAVLLIYTESTQPVYKRLLTALQEGSQVFGLKTDAYDIAVIERQIDQKLHDDKLFDQSLVFNLTGGTKPMSIAAYQVAQRYQSKLLYLESEGKQSRIYHYAFQEDQLQATSNELLPPCVTLKDFLDVHLGTDAWHEQGPSRSGGGGSFETALEAGLKPHVDEIMVGVSAMQGQIDLDVVVRLANQFAIFEAKSGNNGTKLDGIKQLSTASKYLGTFTRQFYVITVTPSRSHEAIVEASRIRVVSLPNYIAGSSALSVDDTAQLIEVVVKSLQG
ncbi:MAG: DUF1887 family protein [Oscillochloris sp.]|nr:DUF1887 family protein [Oscillochloris sp.]